MSRWTRPIRVGSTLGRGLSGLPGRGRDLKQGYRLELAWPRIVGEMMARYLFPVDVSGDKLTVGVTSAVFMQEAEYQRDSLLANIARELGSGVIRHLAFRMLPKAPKPYTPPAPAKAPAKPAAPPSSPLSGAEAAHLEKELERIADPGLREQMRRILARSLERYR